MDFCLQSDDFVDCGVWDESRAMFSSEGLRKPDNLYSFSVVYRMNDFPFPSIHYPTDDCDTLDSQTSFDGIGTFDTFHTSMDASSGASMGEGARVSPRGRFPLLIIPDNREQECFLTPVKPMDSRGTLGGRKVDVENDSHLNACDGGEISDKELGTVEFRSGYRGVSWNRRMKAWLAFWSEGKNRRSKTFNAKVMGFDKARAAAIDFLKKKKQMLQQVDEQMACDGCHRNVEVFGSMDDEDFGESHSLADSATTTSDSPNSSEVGCGVCQKDVTSPRCLCIGDSGPSSHQRM